MIREIIKFFFQKNLFLVPRRTSTGWLFRFYYWRWPRIKFKLYKIFGMGNSRAMERRLFREGLKKVVTGMTEMRVYIEELNEAIKKVTESALGIPVHYFRGKSPLSSAMEARMKEENWKNNLC